MCRATQCGMLKGTSWLAKPIRTFADPRKGRNPRITQVCTQMYIDKGRVWGGVGGGRTWVDDDEVGAALGQELRRHHGLEVILRAGVKRAKREQEQPLARVSSEGV